jgi:hypothetical protein
MTASKQSQDGTAFYLRRHPHRLILYPGTHFPPSQSVAIPLGGGGGGRIANIIVLQENIFDM